MRVFIRLLALVASLLSSLVAAQSPVNPTGHWEGIVQVPDRPLAIAVDLWSKPSGELTGTFAQPDQAIKALPLAAVTAVAREVRFIVKGGAQPSTFAGSISGDGKTLKGDVTLGEYVIPFELTRVGDARVAAAPKSPRIDAALVGTWHGALNPALRVVVTLANLPDGTAIGTIFSPDGAAVEMPVAIVQDGARVMLDVAAVGGVFEGELDAATAELVGTWRQAGTSLPLTLVRTKPQGDSE
ncbi:hypothetical protein [Luteitalea sp.]|uniref:hypothetical protein n=1 Tax=Luteitalea sp. TaxID=2004800 RepID=UPI0025B7CD87|nr:hypothetical protein [Luteitalea sp.]